MINITSDLLSKFNPAYNNSIITFNSTITGMTRGEITVNDKVFKIYPFNEVYKFNFKEIASTYINLNGFEDTILPDIVNDGYVYDDQSLQLTLSAQINTTNALTGDTTTVSYHFLKSVEQLIGYNRKLQSSTDIRVLLPTINFTDYYLTYFEGFPIDFAFSGLVSGDTFNFKNANSGVVTQIYTATTNEVKRFFLSDGSYDSTIANELALSSNLNKVELWVNGVFKANIYIRKIESQCGIYLKWFNQNGGYSYWLFDKFYKESLKVKDLDDINGTWGNLQDVTYITNSLGKTANSTIQLTASYNKNEKDYLLDILKSPKVEMYIHQSPFIKVQPYDFIGIKVSDGNTNYENKSNINKLRISIELPPINTITY